MNHDQEYCDMVAQALAIKVQQLIMAANEDTEKVVGRKAEFEFGIAFVVKLHESGSTIVTGTKTLKKEDMLLGLNKIQQSVEREWE